VGSSWKAVLATGRTILCGPFHLRPAAVAGARTDQSSHAVPSAREKMRLLPEDESRLERVTAGHELLTGANGADARAGENHCPRRSNCPPDITAIT
jgi:hypothetical protein